MAHNIIIHQRGWVDTRLNLQQTFKEDPLLKQLVTRNCTALFSRNQSSVDDLSKLSYLITYAGYAIQGGTIPNTNHILVVSLGELVAPVLPSNFFLSTELANRIKECIAYLMENETVVNRGKTRDQFIALHNAIPVSRREEDWEEIRNDISTSDLLTTQGDNYVSFLLTSGVTDQHLKAIDLFTTMFIAVAKRGNVTDEFLDKINRGLQDDLQYQARLDGEVISLVYRFYGAYVDASNAKQVLDLWLRDIPEIALRVRLTLQQATNSGITAFVIIGRAITKYPDFPWARLNLLTGGELTAYKAALTVANGNPYFGFNKTMGAARSTLYSSIAYVAKELLIQLNGESSLKRYAGWIKAPKSVSVVRSLIDSYKTKHTEEMEGGIVGETDINLLNDVQSIITNAEFSDMFA